MVYYWDGDRNVYIQVNQPDNSISVGSRTIRGSNTIRGHESNNLTDVRNKYIEEVNKHETTSARRSALIQLYDNQVRNTNDKIEVANDMLYSLLQSYYEQQSEPQSEPQPNIPNVLTNAGDLMNAEYGFFG